MRSTTPESSRADEEGVLHRARRVVRAEVERVEVEPLGLDLGALGDLPAHRDEDVLDALHEGGERVARARGTAVVGQRDVDGLLDQHARVALVLELDLAALERLADRPRACPTRLPASALACGGSAPISRLASASGLRSPACASRASLSASRSAAAAIAASASATAASTASGCSTATSTGSNDLFGADMLPLPDAAARR